MTPDALRKRFRRFVDGKKPGSYAEVMSTIGSWLKVCPGARLPSREMQVLVMRFPTIPLDMKFTADLPEYEFSAHEQLLEHAVREAIPAWARAASMDDLCTRKGCGESLRSHVFQGDARRITSLACTLPGSKCQEYLPKKEKKRG